MPPRKAAAVDNVFGGIVYRISGNTYSPFVSVNYGFTDRFSVDAGYRYERGEGSSLKYDNRIVHAAAIFRF